MLRENFYTSPYGVAERKNRSVVEAARAMLEEKSFPKFYWAEVVRTAVYIQNRIGDKVSAHELYFRTKPNKAPRISLRREHLGSVPTEEVPIRNKASPACLEHEDHAATASDGLCDVEVGLFTVHPERSTRSG